MKKFKFLLCITKFHFVPFIVFNRIQLTVLKLCFISFYMIFFLFIHNFLSVLLNSVLFLFTKFVLIASFLTKKNKFLHVNDFIYKKFNNFIIFAMFHEIPFCSFNIFNKFKIFFFLNIGLYIHLLLLFENFWSVSINSILFLFTIFSFIAQIVNIYYSLLIYLWKYWDF